MRKLLVVLFIILTSCSIVQVKTTFELVEKKEFEPICTTWNGNNGAALTEINGTLIKIESPYDVDTPFFGPLLLPIVPNLFSPNSFDQSISAAITIEIIPGENKLVKINPQRLQLFFDKQKINLNSGFYEKETANQNENINGSIQDLEKEIVSKYPIKITLTDGLKDSTPKVIKVTLAVEIDSVKYLKNLEFKRDIDWSYWPVWVPTMHTNEDCKVVLPNSRRNLF